MQPYRLQTSHHCRPVLRKIASAGRASERVINRAACDDLQYCGVAWPCEKPSSEAAFALLVTLTHRVSIVSLLCSLDRLG
jgi:hypothetical protein